MWPWVVAGDSRSPTLPIRSSVRVSQRGKGSPAWLWAVVSCRGAEWTGQPPGRLLLAWQLLSQEGCEGWGARLWFWCAHRVWHTPLRASMPGTARTPSWSCLCRWHTAVLPRVTQGPPRLVAWSIAGQPEPALCAVRSPVEGSRWEQAVSGSEKGRTRSPTPLPAVPSRLQWSQASPARLC